MRGERTRVTLNWEQLPQIFSKSVSKVEQKFTLKNKTTNYVEVKSKKSVLSGKSYPSLLDPLLFQNSNLTCAELSDPTAAG